MPKPTLLSKLRAAVHWLANYLVQVPDNGAGAKPKPAPKGDEPPTVTLPLIPLVDLLIQDVDVYKDAFASVQAGTDPYPVQLFLGDQTPAFVVDVPLSVLRARLRAAHERALKSLEPGKAP